MKVLAVILCLLAACTGAQAKTALWQPAAGHAQLPLWPGTPPDAQPMPGPEYTTTGTRLLGGKTVTGVYNVSRPTMTVYAPVGRNSGAAVVVFPGGGFEGLAMDLEGTEACDWLVSRGITCVLLKYRVPSLPYDWHCKCRPDDFVVPTMALEDAQRAMGLVRLHAGEWHIDPHKVGVMGFSAGGFLVAEISTRYAHRLYPAVDAADKESARPDFALAIYPGHLATDDDKLNPNVPVTRETSPTFLVQAEDDYVDGVNQSLVYYAALAKARVPAELHLYAHGGHAFGLRRTRQPITGWPDLAEAWLRTIGALPH
ncbi:alpha/beta hydrolase [Rhodanobacter sp. Si-c]|uniref:Alpha/beta hydrolase n=1 Tax=Rhodanobacter lycopersici TaxID=3162487 RepID=A0ABV3QDK7_9GAMM